MNPELSVILFTVDMAFLVILLAGAVWSVAFPAQRAWPPPQRRSWQYVLTWASYDAVCGLSTALLFLEPLAKLLGLAAWRSPQFS